MLPDAVTNGQDNIRLQSWLRQQAAEVTSQYIAAAALRQKRISGRIDGDFSAAPAHQSLVPFQNHPAVPKTLRKFSYRGNAIALNGRSGRLQHASSFAGVRCDYPERARLAGTGRQPIQRARVSYHW